MAERILTANVRETGESSFAVAIDVDGHLLKGDQPESAGGANLGPDPHEMLLASLGECTAMTVRWYARQHNWPLDEVSVALTYRHGTIEGQTGLKDIFTKAVHLTGAALTPEQHAKLIDVAAKCPIQRLLEGTPIIRTSEQV
jgi:putative redox protein